MITDDPVVLIVDDSEADQLLMRVAFKRAGFIEPLQFADDGDEAFGYLIGSGRYANRRLFPLPTVTLLDLSMPRKNGFELLVWIRKQTTLARLPIYILSTSNRSADIDQAYDLGANSYMVKPTNLDGLTHLAEGLLAWIRLSHFASLRVAKDARELPQGSNGVEAGLDLHRSLSKRE